MPSMKNINQILNEILEEIKPDKEYEQEIFKRLNAIIKKINHKRKGFHAILGGSGAKGTWLKVFDADIFVLFDYNKYKDKSNELSNILEKALKKKSPHELHKSKQKLKNLHLIMTKKNYKQDLQKFLAE